MANDRLAVFRAASEFAEFAAGFPGLLRLLADYNMTAAVARQIRNIHSEWKRHSDGLACYQDALHRAANDVLECAGTTYPNAHAAAIDQPSRILAAIECMLLLSGTIDKSSLTVSRELPLPDSSLVGSNWPAVRHAILTFPVFDASAVISRVARERSKVLERFAKPTSRAAENSRISVKSSDSRSNQADVENQRRLNERMTKPRSGDAGDDRPRETHSPDFRSVNWFGVNYSFTPNQAACVKVLWDAWQSGAPEVGGETLLQAADASTQRIDVVFRGNAAWGTMIVQGGTKGSYRLANPTSDSPKRPKRKTKKASARTRK